MSEKDAATEICIVYGSCATSVQTVRGLELVIFIWKMKDATGLTSTTVMEIIKAMVN